MFGIPLEDIFQHEGIPSSLEAYQIDENTFKNYPFVICEIDPKHMNNLEEIFKRSVCILRIV